MAQREAMVIARWAWEASPEWAAERRARDAINAHMDWLARGRGWFTAADLRWSDHELARLSRTHEDARAASNKAAKALGFWPGATEADELAERATYAAG